MKSIYKHSGSSVFSKQTNGVDIVKHQMEFGNVDVLPHSEIKVYVLVGVE
jgi:hypothetical protein